MLKLWKCFRIWKKAVNHAKFAYAKASLEKNLFMLSPVFQVGKGGRCAVRVRTTPSLPTPRRA